MKKISPILRFISHNITWVVIIAGIAIVGFLDENSFVQRAKNEIRKRELREQINEFTRQYECDQAQLHELRHNPDAITRVAREKYFMKTDDEDIFVFSEEE